MYLVISHSFFLPLKADWLVVGDIRELYFMTRRCGVVADRLPARVDFAFKVLEVFDRFRTVQAQDVGNALIFR